MAENTSEPTPLLPAGSKPEEKPADVIDLEKIVNESKAALQAEPAKPKRGPGRPRKNPRPIEAAGSSVSPEPRAPASGPEQIQPTMVPMLAGATKIICASIAEARDYPEYNVSDDEANYVGEATDQFLKVYLPDAATQNPKAVAGISLGIAIASVFGLRELKYRAHVTKTPKTAKSEKSEKDESKESEAPPKPSEFGTIDAYDYFKDLRGARM